MRNRVPMLIGRRNVEGGGRQQDFHNSSFRGLIGSRGDIAEGWTYDTSVQFSRTSANQITLNFFSIPKINNALDAVRDADGNITCRSVVDGTDPTCVPYQRVHARWHHAPGSELHPGTWPADRHDRSERHQGVITGDLGTIGRSCRGRTSRSRSRSVSRIAATN
jgi:hypothetical protein